MLRLPVAPGREAGMVRVVPIEPSGRLHIEFAQRTHESLPPLTVEGIQAVHISGTSKVVPL